MMKKIFLILSIFLLGLNSHSQYTKHILTSGTGYPAANGIRMAFGVHIPPPNPNGKLPMLWLFLHGGGERGPRGDTTTSSGIVRVTNIALPNMIRNTNIGRYVAPGGGTTDSLGVAVIFPQCSDEYGTWPMAYPAEMIKWAKANLADQVDTNRIIINGLSLGGGGTLGSLGYSFTRENAAAFFSICPGYYAFTNRKEVADSCGPVYVYMAANDASVPIANADGMVQSTNEFRPVWPIQYFRFSGATPGFSGHNIWGAIYTTGSGANAALSNGDVYVHKNIYSEGARFTKQRYKRP